MEQNKHEDNSLQNLRNKVQEFWEDGRLDEDYMRESRNLCLQADEVRMESLISRALLTRNNEKFLKLINLGLPLNYSSFGNFSANILSYDKRNSLFTVNINISKNNNIAVIVIVIFAFLLPL